MWLPRPRHYALERRASNGQEPGRAKVSATYLGLRAETEVAVSRARVASLFCSVDTMGRAEVKRQLEALGGLTVVDSIDVGPTPPALSTLLPYSAVVIWADTSRGCSDPTGLGNVLAQYVDRGGGVVQILPYYLNYSYSGLSGDFTRYSLVNSTNSMRYARDLNWQQAGNARHPGQRQHAAHHPRRHLLSPQQPDRERSAQRRALGRHLVVGRRHGGGRQPGRP